MSSPASPANENADAAAKARRALLKEVTADGVLITPGSVADSLRTARAKVGLDLDAVAKTLRIKREYLDALESGRTEALPGRPYAFGFLRAYAEMLGLDVAEISERFRSEYKAPEVAAPIVAEPATGGLDEVRLPQGAMIMAFAFVVLAIFAGVYLFQSASETLEERRDQGTTTTPERPVTTAPVAQTPPPATVTTTPQGEATASTVPTGAPAADSTTLATPPAAATTTSPPATVTPVPTGPAAAASGPAAPAKPLPGGPALSRPAVAPVEATNPGESAEAPPAPVLTLDERVAAADRTFGAINRQARVALIATQEVFVRIETEGGRNQVLFEQILKPGQVYFVPSVGDVVLVTRNGGALDLFVDGEAKGAAGPAGVALKGLPLEADVLKERR